MADPRRRVRVGPHHLRIASGKMFIPDDVASHIENMYLTTEGTLRSVVGPVPYVPDTPAAGGGAPPSGGTPSTQFGLTYGNVMKGITHALINGGHKEILLLHTLDQIWTFRGWQHKGVGTTAWYPLMAPPGTSPVPGTTAAMPNDQRPRYPTQFVTTPTGVVIIPQDSRAHFYDGEIALPLGYGMTPGPPVGIGPDSQQLSTAWSYGWRYADAPEGWVNNTAYAHDGLIGFDTEMSPTFKYGRIGTTIQSGTSTEWSKVLDPDAGSGTLDIFKDSGAGWLEPGSWRCCVQFVDRWGNLSPLSGPSNDVRLERQASLWIESDGGAPPTYSVGPTLLERVRKQLGWTGVPLGPTGTLGRILYRTKDTINSGTAKFFELPLNSTTSADVFATLPDNVTTFYPDNIPDFWLSQNPLRPIPVRNFKVGALAFGRLWTGNFEGAPGLIYPSMIGRWGTFLEDEGIYPDPSGGAITGFLTVPNGLLAYTEVSTYRIEPYYDGEGFRSMSLSQTVGCDAPSSAQNLPDGRSIWKARDGFYTYDGTTIKYISEELEEFWKSHNQARACQATSAVDGRAQIYRCWVSVNGERENSRCYEYDGMGWRIRTDVSVAAACTTQDHRGYTLAAGKHGTTHGVWLLDHEVKSYDPAVTQNREAIIKTAWMSAVASQKRRTMYQLRLWLVEHSSSDITVEIQRDWRETITETHTVPQNPTDDPPPFWNTAVLDATDTTWLRRRPYWRRVQIYVPSAEVFRMIIRGTGRWEFIGFEAEEVQHQTGGSRMPP